MVSKLSTGIEDQPSGGYFAPPLRRLKSDDSQRVSAQNFPSFPTIRVAKQSKLHRGGEGARRADEGATLSVRKQMSEKYRNCCWSARPTILSFQLSLGWR